MTIRDFLVDCAVGNPSTVHFVLHGSYPVPFLLKSKPWLADWANKESIQLLIYWRNGHKCCRPLRAIPYEKEYSWYPFIVFGHSVRSLAYQPAVNLSCSSPMGWIIYCHMLFQTYSLVDWMHSQYMHLFETSALTPLSSEENLVETSASLLECQAHSSCMWLRTKRFLDLVWCFHMHCRTFLTINLKWKIAILLRGIPYWAGSSLCKKTFRISLSLLAATRRKYALCTTGWSHKSQNALTLEAPR